MTPRKTCGPSACRWTTAVLVDLRERLARTRWPDQIDGTGWEYGVPLGYMRELVRVLAQRSTTGGSTKRKLNELPQFITKIDGLDIHFVHVRSKEKDALPLVIMHGWPGSFASFTRSSAR